MSKQALVIVDCWRYDHRNLFYHEGMEELNHVVAVSNWTLPCVTTMITGLHPLKHKVGVKPREDGTVSFSGGKKVTECPYETLLDREGAIAVVEIPILNILKPARPVLRRKKIHTIAQKYIGAPFLILHFAGGHRGWPHARSKDEHEGYRNELKWVADKLEPITKEILDAYDTVVLAADHGRYFKVHRKNHRADHGAEFNIGVLHTPLFYKGPQIADELYDTRVIYDILVGKRPVSTQVAISCRPVHLEHKRIALTYLVDGELRQDIVKTSEDWDMLA